MSERRTDETASWDARRVRRAAEEGARPAIRQSGGGGILSALIYAAFVVLTSAILAGVGWMLGSDFCAFNRGELREVTLEVTAADTVATVAQKLKEAGLIRYPWFFKFYGGLAGAEEKIGVGTYQLNTEMDYRALILGMRSVAGSLSAETVSVTIPEGYTVRQTIRLLAEKGVNTEENLLAAAAGTFPHTFLTGSGEDLSRLEGYLFPDTYEFYVNHNAKNALEKLMDAFADHMNQDAFEESAAKAMGYTLQEVVIVASLIEKETDGSDQGNIASVIYNRLRNQSGETAGFLQIDAALLYGLPDHTGAITNEDKAVDTPYNLYLHKGLPPTAIANPGQAALDAAMNPNETKYYYYALGTDKKHHFSETLAQHNAFIASGDYAG